MNDIALPILIIACVFVVTVIVTVFYFMDEIQQLRERLDKLERKK